MNLILLIWPLNCYVIVKLSLHLLKMYTPAKTHFFAVNRICTMTCLLLHSMLNFFTNANNKIVNIHRGCFIHPILHVGSHKIVKCGGIWWAWRPYKKSPPLLFWIMTTDHLASLSLSCRHQAGCPAGGNDWKLLKCKCMMYESDRLPPVARVHIMILSKESCSQPKSAKWTKLVMRCLC